MSELEFPTAKIEALLLTENPDDFYSSPRNELVFDFDGIVGDERHRGRTMLADVRIKSFTKKQAEVLNRQTVSLIDTGSLDIIAQDLNLDPDVIVRQYNETMRIFLARCLGANILLHDFQGSPAIPEFYNLPNATDFGPFNPENTKFSDAALMITRYNTPCIHPGKKIEEHYPGDSEGLAPRFVKTALEHRGYVAMVVKVGKMAVGDSVMFRPLPSAR